jgi:DNA invertase Pin-like site-specific DNA recombinase
LVDRIQDREELTMSKAYMYGRHSTHHQSATEEVQRLACQRHWETALKDKGVEDGGWFYDPASSGGKPFTERESGLRLWLHLQPGDYLIVSKLDRAFRSLLDGARTIQMFAAKGVHFVALDLGMDTSTPLGEFALHVFLAAAQMQRRYTSERTREVLAHKKSQGKLLGRACRSAPFGWRLGGANGFWVEDEAERQQIEEFARWHDQEGLSTRAIELRLRRPEYRWKRRNKHKWHEKYIRLALRARAQGYPPAHLNARSRRRLAGPQQTSDAT